MLVDRFGKTVEVGDWFIRLDQNNEGRIYLLEGHAPDGRINVHEYCKSWADMIGNVVEYITPARLKQTIMKPNRVLWYPQSLLPVVKP